MAVGVMQPSGKFKCAFVRSGRIKVKMKSRISRGSWTGDTRRTCPALEADGEIQGFIWLQIPGQKQRPILELHLRQHILAVEGCKSAHHNPGGGGQRERQERVQFPIGRVFNFHVNWQVVS